MASSRRRYLWFAAFAGFSLAELFVERRRAVERDATEGRLRALVAEGEAEQQRLRAKLDEVAERTRPGFEETNEPRDGAWLCERVRCNQADRVPIWDSVPAKLMRDPFDEWTREPRRGR
jgi:hypothetical protein